MKAKADAAAAAAAAEAEKANQEEEDAVRQHVEAKEDAEQVQAERQKRRKSSKLKSRRSKELVRETEELSRLKATFVAADSKREAVRRHMITKQDEKNLKLLRAKELTDAANADRSDWSDLMDRANTAQAEADRAVREAKEAVKQHSEAEAQTGMLRKEYRQQSSKTVRKVDRRMSKEVPTLESSSDGNPARLTAKSSFCAVLQGDCEESIKHAAGLEKLRSSRKLLEIPEDDTEELVEISEDDTEEPELESLAKSDSAILGENPMLRKDAEVAARPVAGGWGEATAGFAGVLANLRLLCQSSAWPAAGLGVAVGWRLLLTAQRQRPGATAVGALGPGPWAVLVAVSRNAARTSRRPPPGVC